MAGQTVQLDPSQRSMESQEFEAGLRRRIVGQDEAVQAVVDLYQTFRAGLNSPGRPVGNLLLLGPTGAGKTRVVEATAEVLFGDPRAVIKVDCAEFQHSHEIALVNVSQSPSALAAWILFPLLCAFPLKPLRSDCVSTNRHTDCIPGERVRFTKRRCRATELQLLDKCW
jgi:ATP-dependent Clp protease ATP-binding subunit ClpB